MARFARGLVADVRVHVPGLLRGNQRERFLREWPPWCARALVEKTQAACPGALDTDPTLRNVLSDHDERREAARFSASGDGHWIVEWASVHHVVRVWETSPDGLRLAWLLGPAEHCAPVDGPGNTLAARVVCHVRFEQKFGSDDRQYLLVLDLAASKVHRFDDVEGWQQQGNQLVLASSRRLRRVDWPKLEITADVPTPPGGSASHPLLLAEGRSVLLDDVLVSVESGAVLARALGEVGKWEPPTISPDGRRFFSCVAGKLASVDAATGRAQAIAGGHECGIAPAFATEGRAVGVDETVGRSGGRGASTRTLTPFVVDVQAGTARSLPAAAFRTARRGGFSHAYLPADTPGRICVFYARDSGRGLRDYGPDAEEDVCPWQLDASGGLSRKLPPDPFGTQALGLVGKEMARAASPDGRTMLVATGVAHPQAEGDAPQWELGFAEVSADSRRVLRVLRAVRRGLSEAPADPPEPYFSFPGKLSFLGSKRAVLATTPIQVVDLSAGTILEANGELLAGRWAISTDHAALIDLLTLKRFPLEPDEASWRAVKSYGSQCPERLEAAEE